MKILFIQTGGTIDKDYPKTKAYAFEIGEPAVKRILNKINPNFSYKILPLVRKDSLDLNNLDRDRILKVCRQAREEKIIITHGTDTMVKTAKVLSVIKNKTVVITGSLRPEKFADSDAAFNLGLAVAAVQVLHIGVYIAMSGRIVVWNKVRKDLKTGKFVVS